jgi:CHAT domain-containing protein
MQQALYPKAKFPDGYPELATSLNNLGNLLQLRGEYAQAEPFYRDALAMRKALYPKAKFPDGHPELAISLNNRGGLLQLRGEYAQAEPFLRDALSMSQHLAALFANASAEAETLNFLYSQLPHTRDLFLDVTAHAPGSSPADTYVLLWQGKAALARALERRQRLLHQLGDGEARRDLQKLLDVRRQLAQLLLGLDKQTQDRDRRLRDLTRDKEDLEKRLATQLPQLDTAPGSHTDLVERLPRDTAFVDFHRYLHQEKAGQEFRPHYAAFVLRHGHPVRRVELGRAQPIESALAAWHQAIAKGLDHPAAAELRRLVWDPLATHLPDRPGSTVYLCPDGELSALPWAALPGRAKGTILLEDHTLALVPHGPFLVERLRERDAPRPASAGLVLTVGGVRYDRSVELVGPRPTDHGGKPGVWPELPATVREAELVTTLARGLSRPPAVIGRVGTEASPTQLLADLPRARWTHLATHGFFATRSSDVRKYLYHEIDFVRGIRGERVGPGARNPLTQTGLVLAGANPTGKETGANGGILTAEAITGLDLSKMDLAVLSACETGLGEAASGEGVFGLQRAFHLGGCRNVVASLWKVDDEATAALMAVFYQQLWVEGNPPIEALRQAQLALYRNPQSVRILARGRGPDFDKTVKRVTQTPKEQTPQKYASTRDWAGFVLSGAGW